ncbi:unnamed protein product [Gordionus sp. m RMFG-2023]
MKRPKYQYLEELKDFQFWRALRCEMLGTFLYMIFLSGVTLNYQGEKISLINDDFKESCNIIKLSAESKIMNGPVMSWTDAKTESVIKYDWENRDWIQGTKSRNNNETVNMSDSLTDNAHYNTNNSSELFNTNVSFMLSLNKKFNQIKLTKQYPHEYPDIKLNVSPSLLNICVIIENAQPIHKDYVTLNEEYNILKIAIVSGFSMCILIQIFGHISGAHLNPAITLSYLAVNHISVLRCSAYIVCQCLGSIIGVTMIRALIQPSFSIFSLFHPNISDQGPTKTFILPHTDLFSIQIITNVQGFGLEFIMTFVLALIIYSTLDPKKTLLIPPNGYLKSFNKNGHSGLLNEGNSCDMEVDPYNHPTSALISMKKENLDKIQHQNKNVLERGYKMNSNHMIKKDGNIAEDLLMNDKDYQGRTRGFIMYPISVGLYITFATIFGYKYTGASMNPAKSLGPAIINKQWNDHWVYWIGPILGGLMGAFTYEYTATVSSNHKSLGFKRSFRKSLIGCKKSGDESIHRPFYLNSELQKKTPDPLNMPNDSSDICDEGSGKTKKNSIMTTSLSMTGFSNY